MQVDLRALATADIEAAVDHYRDEADSQTALDFIGALEAAIDHLCRYPNSGSLRVRLRTRDPGVAELASTEVPLSHSSTCPKATASTSGASCTPGGTSRPTCRLILPDD